MNTEMLSYIKKDSPIHRLTGATKLICFLLWTIAAMITYDTRVLLGLFIVGIVVFKMSKIEFKEVSFVLYFILFFLLLNALLIFIFAPYQGVEIYGSRTDLLHLIGPYTITKEQLFYELNVVLKYFATIPMALLFILTTDPSEFAASLNKIGVSYKAAYTVSIALRYIPDVQRDYKDISFAQQARGIDLSKKEKLSKRIKNSAAILMPLIFSSLERIDKISLAMELRAFGNNKKRTWFNRRKFEKRDYISILVLIIILLISIVMIKVDGSRFYNPFI
ncbi:MULTISPECIES: energy-coupling factor transporter transmembrane component T family protein [unclassified Romboutsia]|uniref:energy-coupling factor transporter transmembrane component T family protein n=1 Tax=unclassified Romboutsia TaxID=2626894 RepID=UPI00189772CE|nr:MULTISPECIES: energy-coupling factor transporter transmembrane component T [unclassified Romboutsia]MDB8806150.1 energy-coupling factor transporter transmembrane component T [Romboutsia sp. 1001216sp1]MDB8808682.1 energy-coupling factor transporter transmembrane component T [Romboutsia sp. 1001216sp1]MDB8811827.1 energy-coupling factor transporter transmembrane component T [Romboutsia sp. 1001216sp1]MDB8817514.1 energy-coupling factor transporter transmembrane component T [Romboutsia sp. 100